MTRATADVNEMQLQAQRAQAAGRPGVAWLLLAAARQLEPRNAGIAGAAAQTLIDTGRAEQALALLTPLIAHAPAAALFACRARAFSAMNDDNAAIHDGIEALARLPEDGATAALLATLLMQRGEIARSVNVLARAISAGAGDARLHSALAAGRRVLGRADA